MKGTLMRNAIWLMSSPDAQQSFLKLDEKAVKPKVGQVQKTTKLGTHLRDCTGVSKEVACSPVGVEDHWAAAYGKIEMLADRTYGFGPLKRAPAQLTGKLNHI